MIKDPKVGDRIIWAANLVGPNSKVHVGMVKEVATDSWVRVQEEGDMFDFDFLSESVWIRLASQNMSEKIKND